MLANLINTKAILHTLVSLPMQQYNQPFHLIPLALAHTQ